jgi:hypothetical protein
MVGAAFCHICGLGRHRSTTQPVENWPRLSLLKTADLLALRRRFGLPLPSLCAFLTGSVFLIVALAQGLRSVEDISDFEAVQLWRIEWLIAACAAFLAGILLRSRKSED